MPESIQTRGLDNIKDVETVRFRIVNVRSFLQLIISINYHQCHYPESMALNRYKEMPHFVIPPGGMSTTRTSSLPQSVPRSILSKALLTKGPRSTAGLSSWLVERSYIAEVWNRMRPLTSMKKAILITFTLKFSLGRSSACFAGPYNQSWGTSWLYPQSIKKALTCS